MRNGTNDGFLDGYTAVNPAEFYAVVTEAFFDIPLEIEVAKPTLYDVLRDSYRQDPAHVSRTKARRGSPTLQRIRTGSGRRWSRTHAKVVQVRPLWHVQRKRHTNCVETLAAVSRVRASAADSTRPRTHPTVAGPTQSSAGSRSL